MLRINPKGARGAAARFENLCRAKTANLGNLCGQRRVVASRAGV